MSATAAARPKFVESIEETLVIPADIDRLERYITERENLAKWFSPVTTLEPLDGWGFEPGKRYKLRFAVLFGAGLDYEVVSRKRTEGRLEFTFKFDGLMRGTDRWTFQALEDGRTEVRNRLNYTIDNEWMILGWKLIGHTITWLDMREQLYRLRRVVEQDLSTPRGLA